MEDAKLNHYRERLLEMEGRLTGEVRQTVEHLREQSHTPGEVTSLPTHTADQDSEGVQCEISLESSREQVLDAVKDALRRIEEKSYGTCEDCGKEIPEARLNALPHATRCVDCEEKREDTA